MSDVARAARTARTSRGTSLADASPGLPGTGGPRRDELVVQNLGRADDGDPLAVDGAAERTVGLRVVATDADDRKAVPLRGRERVAEPGDAVVEAVVVRHGRDVDARASERRERRRRRSERELLRRRRPTVRHGGLEVHDRDVGAAQHRGDRGERVRRRRRRAVARADPRSARRRRRRGRPVFRGPSSALRRPSNRRSTRGRGRKRAARRADSSGHDSHVRFAPTTSSSWSRLGRGAQGDRAAGRDRRRDRHCRDARGRPLPVAADVGERGVRPDPGHLLVRDRHVDRDLLAGRGGRRLLGVEVARSAGRRRGGPADPRPHRTRDRLDGRACDPRDRARHRQRVRALREREGERRTSSTFA